MRNGKRSIALLLALFMVTACVHSLAEGEAVQAGDAGPSEHDDAMSCFLGDWILVELYLSGGYYPPSLLDETHTLTIQPDAILIQSQYDSVTYTGEATASGDTLTLVDEEDYSWRFQLEESGTLVRVDQSPALLFYERAGTESTKARELTYSPGEDLLLADQRGYKVWLKGKQENLFRRKSGDVLSLFTLTLENETDQTVCFSFSGTVNGYPMMEEGHLQGAANEIPPHGTGEHELVVYMDGFREVNGLDEKTAFALLAVPNEIVLDIGVTGPMKSDYSSDILKVFDPVTVRFGNGVEAVSVGAEDPVDTGIVQAEPGEADVYASNDAAAAADESDGSGMAAQAATDPDKVHKDKATVKAVQQALNDAGYDCGKPDGSAGRKTKAAISAYQTDRGLTVTGTVTDELLSSLGVQ